MRLERKIVNIDGEKIICEFLLKEENIVILHGAGNANRKRYYSMAESIIKIGKGVVLFDFSGHGESSGKLGDLSLKRRRIQAKGVIDSVIPDVSDLYLVGFSMSGQTVCDLLPAYGDRIKGILLGCPGIYSNLAHDMKFNSTRFTSTIREYDSWKDSTAFKALRAFSAKTIITIGDRDHVIPRGVITSLRSAAKDVVYVQYPGVDHQLAVWLSENQTQQGTLLKMLINE